MTKPEIDRKIRSTSGGVLGPFYVRVRVVHVFMQVRTGGLALMHDSSFT